MASSLARLGALFGGHLQGLGRCLEGAPSTNCSLGREVYLPSSLSSGHLLPVPMAHTARHGIGSVPSNGSYMCLLPATCYIFSASAACGYKKTVAMVE